MILLLNDVSKLDFSNETASTAITFNLPTGQNLLDGTSNESYGYVGGGRNTVVHGVIIS